MGPSSGKWCLAVINNKEQEFLGKTCYTYNFSFFQTWIVISVTDDKCLIQNLYIPYETSHSIVHWFKSYWDRHTDILSSEYHKRTCGLATPYINEEYTRCLYNETFMDPNTSAFYYPTREIYKDLYCSTCRSEDIVSFNMFGKIRTSQLQRRVRTVVPQFQIPLGAWMPAFSVLFGCLLQTRVMQGMNHRQSRCKGFICVKINSEFVTDEKHKQYIITLTRDLGKYIFQPLWEIYRKPITYPYNEPV